MRDATILEGFQRMTDAISQDHAKLTRTNALLRTRIDAMEGLLLDSRLGLIKLALLQLISPAMARRALGARHGDEIQRFNRDRQVAARTRPPVVKAPTDGLITI